MKMYHKPEEIAEFLELAGVPVSRREKATSILEAMLKLEFNYGQQKQLRKAIKRLNNAQV